jgi:hypothetical protein
MIALGGTSYAAFRLPNNSVTSKKIKNGAVHASDLGNGSVSGAKLAANAVTTSKLADASVSTSKLADASVSTSKLADASVTSTKLAPASVTGTSLAPNAITESDVAPGSLTGAAFQCATGDEGLDNRHMCFFALSAPGATWAEAVARCRARGNTPATLASPAEIEAAAALGGSPFNTGTYWTSQISAGGLFASSSAWAVEVSGGAIVDFLSTPVTSTTIPSIACVYHASDES